MQCTHCHTENRPGRRFCAECGAPSALACVACGFANEPGEKFCGGCGTPLSTASPIPTPRLPSPQAYTPSHLTDKILEARPALAGERKQVTVLFADLKDSTELIRGLDPEAAQQPLDPAMHHMMDAVHRFEGTVTQVLGGRHHGPVRCAHCPRGPCRARCYAALAMQEAMRHYSAELRRRHGVEVQIRVGLNSCAVVVRAIGNDLHMDDSAIGQTTHLAARMEQLAAPGSIRLTANGRPLRIGPDCCLSEGETHHPILVRAMLSPPYLCDPCSCGGLTRCGMAYRAPQRV
jgi:class 3 adenylate cyclase